jgi:hypothetical protein
MTISEIKSQSLSPPFTSLIFYFSSCWVTHLVNTATPNDLCHIRLPVLLSTALPAECQLAASRDEPHCDNLQHVPQFPLLLSLWPFILYLLSSLRSILYWNVKVGTPGSCYSGYPGFKRRPAVSLKHIDYYMYHVFCRFQNCDLTQRIVVCSAIFSYQQPLYPSTILSDWSL